MSMVPNNPEYKTYIYSLIELVKEGRVSTDRIDDAVRRIQGLKAELGLLDGRKFDKNYYKDFNQKNIKNYINQLQSQLLC